MLLCHLYAHSAASVPSGHAGVWAGSTFSPRSRLPTTDGSGRSCWWQGKKHLSTTGQCQVNSSCGALLETSPFFGVPPAPGPPSPSECAETLCVSGCSRPPARVRPCARVGATEAPPQRLHEGRCGKNAALVHRSLHTAFNAHLALNGAKLEC